MVLFVHKHTHVHVGLFLYISYIMSSNILIMDIYPGVQYLHINVTCTCHNYYTCCIVHWLCICWFYSAAGALASQYGRGGKVPVRQVERV